MDQRAIEVDHGGRTIRGMVYLPAGGRRAPAVLFLHAFTGQRIESGFMFVQLARALAQLGVAAVTFDFLHSGESDGSFDQMLVSGQLADARRMTQWLQSQPFADRARLGVLGFSLGGLTAACLCARVTAYGALVLIAPTTVENLCRVAGESRANGPPSVGPHELNPGFFDDLRRFDPVGDCVANPRPTLIVQGSADAAVPPDVAAQFETALRQAGTPVQAESVPEADHNFSRPRTRRHLIQSVANWCEGVLGEQR